MKAKKHLVVLLLMFVTLTINAQKKKITTAEELKNYAVQNYFEDLKINEAENRNRVVNYKALNILFADEVSSYIGDSKDLSLQKGYALISTADKTLFIGGTWDFGRDDKLKKLTHLLTVGLKGDLKDDFSTVFKNGEAKNNIGLNIKYTWIGKGILNFGKHKETIIRYRENILRTEFQKELDKYLKDEGDKDKIKVLEALSGKDLDKAKEESIYSKKAKEIYTKIADAEVKLIKENKIYNWLWDHYIVFEGYMPITKKSYAILPDTNTSTTKTEEVLPFKLLAGYTNFWKQSNGNVFYLSGILSAFNNNNAAIEDLENFNLQKPNVNNSNLIEETTSVFVGEFEEFITSNFKVEAVSYFVKEGMFGLSAAVEQNFGDYDALNWKLGLPVSLKDKEGKPTVNFELQWKEVNGDHLVGIGVGFAFGKFIK